MRILANCDFFGWRPRHVLVAAAPNNWWYTLKKLIPPLFLILSILTFALDTALYEWYFVKRENITCFDLPGNLLPQFDDNEPELGAGIFFHETSCPKDLSDIPLNSRQACSVESALKAHPYTDVFLLISSPIFTTLEETKNVYVRQLLSYSNFKLRHITFSKYLSDTPLNVVYTSGRLNQSFWPVSHSSDILRYATLYKFGGIYLDLDVIVLKPLIELRNFAGAQAEDTVGAGTMGFGYDNTGREMAQKCAQDLARTFNGRLWGNNGPGVITRVLQEICGVKNVFQMCKSFCKGFRVFPFESFLALNFHDAEFFFQEGKTAEVRKIFNQSFVIHFWNKLTSKIVIKNNQSDVPFLKYARKKCPKVYQACDGYF